MWNELKSKHLNIRNEMWALSGEGQLVPQVCIKMWALFQEGELGRPVIDEK